MNIQLLKSVDQAGEAQGLAIIIDVFRAFSTEAFVFANGAEKIIPVLTLEEAFALKSENPDYILMGERGGLKVEGFDFGNGPTEVVPVDFSGKTIIHTTSNGTKGLVNAIHADAIIVGSFVMAKSIVEYIKAGGFREVSLVSTSPYTDMNNEDILCAQYIKDLLEGVSVDEQQIIADVKAGPVHKFLTGELHIPISDIDYCLEFNKFNFIIKKVVENGQIVLVKQEVL